MHGQNHIKFIAMAVLPAATSGRESIVKPFIFAPTTEATQEMYVELKIEALLSFVSRTRFKLPYYLIQYGHTFIFVYICSHIV